MERSTEVHESGDIQIQQHLELDVEFYRRRAEETAEEKRELEVKVRHLQEALQEACAKLEDQEQQLQHQEIDLQIWRNGGVSGGHLSLSNGPVDGTWTAEEEQLHIQNVLRTAHAELHRERRIRETMERKSTRCVGKLEKIAALVERQRDEIARLRDQAAKAERAAEGRRVQLEEANSQAEALRAALSRRGFALPAQATHGDNERTGYRQRQKLSTRLPVLESSASLPRLTHG